MSKDQILYDARAFIYFVRQADKEQNIDYIETLDSYRNRKRWKFLEVVPSLFFTLFFGGSFIHFLYHNQLGVDKPFVLGVFGVITLLFLYVLYEDIKTFRSVFYPKEEPSFLSGRMVGQIVREVKKKDVYSILLEVDRETTPEVLAVNVSKKLFDRAEVDEIYWLFSEKYDLYAIKDE